MYSTNTNNTSDNNVDEPPRPQTLATAPAASDIAMTTATTMMTPPHHGTETIVDGPPPPLPFSYVDKDPLEYPIKGKKSEHASPIKTPGDAPPIPPRSFPSANSAANANHEDVQQDEEVGGSTEGIHMTKMINDTTDAATTASFGLATTTPFVGRVPEATPVFVGQVIPVNLGQSAFEVSPPPPPPPPLTPPPPPWWKRNKGFIGIGLLITAAVVIVVVVVIMTRPETIPPTPSPTATYRATKIPTSSQTSAPVAVLTREAHIRQRVSQISSMADSDDSNMHRRLTLLWLINIDPKELASDDPHLIQRYAVALLHFALDGPKWDASDGWLGMFSECTWEGIECNKDGTVEQIVLENNNLMGTVPPEVSVFKGLKKLSFADNEISGPLPQEIFELVNLEYLKMKNTNISGSISTEIGNLSKLNDLDLLNTNLDGTLPLEHMFDLTELVRLKLGTESHRDVFNYQVRLDSSYERRSIPSSIKNLAKLQDLQINAGSLSGTIPPEIGEINSLTSVQLYSNFLRGSIPPEIGKLSDLRHLRLNLNNLSGTVPSELGNLASLNTLRLEMNERLYGTLPTEICTDTDIFPVWGVWVTCNIQCCVDCCSLCLGVGRPDDIPCD